MNDTTTSVQTLKDTIAAFVREREWDQFQSPKNLSMSIAIEAAELMEKFQWADLEDSKKDVVKYKEEIANELADIAAYLFNFCSFNDIDLSQAILKKLEINRQKYPIDKVKGSYHNYVAHKKTIKK